jgi:hypothetical protein
MKQYLTGLSFMISAWFMGCGFYKIFFYSNSDYSTGTNVYVGGDAYNYIINSGRATGYFVLALMFVVIGCTSWAINSYKEQNSKTIIQVGKAE